MPGCPHEDEVIAFVSGDLTPREGCALEEHLDVCTTCRHLASSLARARPSADGASRVWRPGDTLGRYLLLERIGSGGMGEVWSATTIVDRSARVALKLLPRLDPDALMLFKREFRAVADISHPNVVALYELASATSAASDAFFSTFFITMERVDGVTFLEHVRGDERKLRSTLAQVAAGLSALHAAHNVHRDIKPSNVRVEPSGRAVILDFGLVSSTSDREHRVAGTPGYMAPELRERRTDAAPTPAADWYALGVMLHEALATGRPTSPPVAPPGPRDLSALCLSLLDPNPATRAGLAAVVEAVGGSVELRPSASPFVARRTELARLREVFDDVRGGATRSIEINGPAGVGKTTLLRRFLDEVRRDAVVLEGRCYDRESVPHKAVDPLIDELVLHLLRLPPDERAALRPADAADLVRMFPALGRAFVSTDAAASTDSRNDPGASRHDAIRALRTLLSSIARQRPLVLAIDDWHWSDEDSAALVEELFRTPPVSVLLVVVHRRRDALLVRGMKATIVDLAPLSMDDSEALARRMLSGATDSLAASIARESAGNPLFIAELTRGRSSEAISRISLDDAIRARLTALPEAERDLLEAITVAGRPIDRTLVTRAAGVGWGEGPLSRLRAERWVEMRRASVEMTHDRVREAIHQSLSVERRATLHRRIGGELEASGERESELLLEHFRCAGDGARARRYAVDAAKTAMAALAFERAARLYGEAASMTVSHDDLATLHALRAEALGAAGRGVASAEAFAVAARYATHDDAIDYRRLGAEELLRCGHIDEGLDALVSVLHEMGTPLLSRPRAAICSIAMRRIELNVRRTLHRHFRTEPEPHLVRSVDLCWRVASALGTVDTVRAAALHTRALSLAVRAGDPLRLSRSLASEAVFAATAGPSAEPRAERLLELAADSARGNDDPSVRGMLEGAAAMTSYLTGRFPRALERCDAAERLFAASTGRSWERQTTRLYALLSLCYLGDISELRRRVSVQLAEAVDRGDIYASTSIRTALTNIAWLAGGDVDEARRAIEEGEGVWSRRGFHLQHHWSLLSRSQIDLYAGDADRALSRIDERWGALSGSFLTRIHVVKVEALHMRARVALAAAGRRDTSKRLAMAARDADDLERMKSPQARALCELVRAGIAVRKGRLPQAAVHLADAARKLRVIDLQLFASAADRRLGELTHDAAQVRRSDAFMRAQTIADPARMTAMLVPGWPD